MKGYVLDVALSHLYGYWTFWLTCKCIVYFQAMSIYSTVSAHNTQTVQNQTEIEPIQYDEPLVKLNALTEKGTTMAGQAISEDDSLAEYFSDDEEREKALQAQKEKKDQQLHKLERDT